MITLEGDTLNNLSKKALKDIEAAIDFAKIKNMLEK